MLIILIIVVGCTPKGGVKPKSKAEFNCDKFGTEVMYHDACLLRKAMAYKDISVCDEMTDEEAKDSCYMTFAYYKKDISICEKVSESEKIRCMNNLGLSSDECLKDYDCEDIIWNLNEDENWCSSLEGLNQIDCFQALAIINGDKSICNKIPVTNEFGEDDVAQGCLMSVAIMTANAEICNELGDPESEDLFKGMCLGYLLMFTGDKSICNYFDEEDREDCLTYDPKDDY